MFFIRIVNSRVKSFSFSQLSTRSSQARDYKMEMLSLKIVKIVRYCELSESSILVTEEKIDSEVNESVIKIKIASCAKHPVKFS